MGCNCIKTFSKDVIILDLSYSKNQVNNFALSPTKSDVSKIPESDDHPSRSRTKPMRSDLSPFNSSILFLI
jgi:hypothetical protein